MKKLLIGIFVVSLTLSLVIKNSYGFDYEFEDSLSGFGWSMGLTDDLDRIFVADGTKNQILVFNKYDNNFLEKILLDDNMCGGHIHGIQIKNNQIFTVKENQDCIAVFDLSGEFLYEFGKKGDKQGEFDGPQNLEVFQKNIFVVDTNNNRIQVFDLSGEFLYEINQNFKSPHQILITDDKWYVLDTYNYQVKIFSYFIQSEYDENSTSSNDFLMMIIISLIISLILISLIIFLRKK